jgi:hypothetical protein
VDLQRSALPATDAYVCTSVCACYEACQMPGVELLRPHGQGSLHPSQHCRESSSTCLLLLVLLVLLVLVPLLLCALFHQLLLTHQAVSHTGQVE